MAQLEHHQVVPGVVRYADGVVRAAPGRIVVVARPVAPRRAIETIQAAGADADARTPLVVAELLDAVVVVVEEHAERGREAGGDVGHDAGDIEVGRRVQKPDRSVPERSERDGVGRGAGPFGAAHDAVDRRRRRRRARNEVASAMRSRDARRRAGECGQGDACQTPIRRPRPFVVRPSPQTVNRHRPSLDLFRRGGCRVTALFAARH